MNSARSRANSEPEIHRLVPVESRPSSSYEFRKPDEEKELPSPIVIQALSEHLGISLDSSMNSQWIVRDCLLRLKEEGWTCAIVTHGTLQELMFHHVASAEKRSTHEIVELHRELASRIAHEYEQLVAKRRDPRYQIREHVYQQLVCQKDSRQVSSPSLIETVLSLLKVNVLNEYYLAQVVKEELDAAYFRMQDIGGPNAVTIDTCFDLNQLVTKLALERVQYVKRLSDSRLLFCVQCHHALADGICGSCGDCLCAPCHTSLHSHGNRLDHLFVFIEQVVCSECESRAADVRCTDCADMFCRSCFTATHQKGKRTKHCVRLPTSVFCFHCNFHEANVICLDCRDILCVRCSCRSHRGGARRNHDLFGIRKAAYLRKLFAGNVEPVMSIIDQYLTTAITQRSPWSLFYDERMEPYWYNFYSRQIRRTSMKDLRNQPEDDKVQDREMRELTDARAQQRAIFTVPPQIKVTFIHTPDAATPEATIGNA